MIGQNIKLNIKFNKDYKIENKTIVNLLNEIDNIDRTLSNFKDGKYKYNIMINKNNNDLWSADINITNEKENTKATENA